MRQSKCLKERAQKQLPIPNWVLIPVMNMIMKIKASTSYIIQSKLASKENRGFTQSNSSSIILGESFIIKQNFGSLYPIPQSTKSPQIAAYQTSLQPFSNRIFNNATTLALWYEDLMAQALLINMHEYFSGQVIFELHPACDAMFYVQNSSAAVPFY